MEERDVNRSRFAHFLLHDSSSDWVEEGYFPMFTVTKIPHAYNLIRDKLWFYTLLPFFSDGCLGTISQQFVDTLFCPWVVPGLLQEMSLPEEPQ